MAWYDLVENEEDAGSDVEDPLIRGMDYFLALMLSRSNTFCSLGHLMCR
jgi:hypothetical protein